MSHTPVASPNPLMTPHNKTQVAHQFPVVAAAASSSSSSGPDAGPESLSAAPAPSHRGRSDGLMAQIDIGPQDFLPIDGTTASRGFPSGSAVSPISNEPQESKALQILHGLSSKAEFYGVAHRGSINVMTEQTRLRKTGIICTIGPKTNSPEGLAGLRKNGMNIMRMNFSHGTHEYHGSVIANLKKSYDVYKEGAVCAIALDTKGPEIRTGNMSKSGPEEVELQAGQTLTITVDDSFKNECTKERIYVDYINLPKVVAVGSLIYIDDGLLSVKVTSIPEDGKTVIGEVLNSGPISSHKGVNLPGTIVDLPAVSEQDKKDLLFGVEQGVDMIFASFIRKPEDVQVIRDVLGPKGARIFIISKIENQEGLANFDRILDVSDGIMVARGDLGIEIPVKKVFLAQKMMIARCNVIGKPVICATQMLESMTVNPRPTRAEASDVANAVIDGSDCVMLSGETAKGKYPNECVRMMHEICAEAEGTLHFRNFFGQIVGINKQKHTNETLAAAAVQAAFEQEAAALIVLSVSGSTARLVAKYRPQCPIICVTTDDVTARQLHLTRGVYPVRYPLAFNPSFESWSGYIDSQVKYAILECCRDGVNLVARNDVAVVVQGWTSDSGHTNTLRVIRI